VIALVIIGAVDVVCLSALLSLLWWENRSRAS